MRRPAGRLTIPSAYPMTHPPLLLPPSADFWPNLANALLDGGFLERHGDSAASDFSVVRVLVPGGAHAQSLRNALAARLQRPFIPPRITTLAAWIDSLPPDPDAPPPASAAARMMSLYGELRQHGWLKKLFSAQRNTDLLPLAQTLLALFDELSRALVPSLHLSPEVAEERWQAALEQLPPPARSILSDEAHLVWALWKSQLSSSDPVAACFSRMMRLAELATEPLVWISATQPDAYHVAFLEAYAQRCPLLPVLLDWRGSAVTPLYAAAWSEILEDEPALEAAIEVPRAVCLHAAGSLEEEAQHGAQTVIDWLQEGKKCVAIIAQDRAVARRIRALLERAQVFVADETGWKLSTTRSAAAVAALLEAVTSRAETIALLDLLKSPFLFAGMSDKVQRVMEIEHALRSDNILGGWEAADAAIHEFPQARELLRHVAEQAARFAGRRALSAWAELTCDALGELGMRDALAEDAAGVQVVTLLDMLIHDCNSVGQQFSFAEWRAFLSLQLESTPFVPADFDRRVVMLQLNGAQLRSFDAALMVGADTDHLPSRLDEMLFFADGVRRELGLPTRELRQRMQLRDFAELLASAGEIVLSWQSFRNGEPNAMSNWIERLQLAMERNGLGKLPRHQVALTSHALQATPPVMPAPSAPHLFPRRLSASAYNSLVACPYQFFATRMLGLAGLDELSDMPQKRDYGDWLHEILLEYHQAIRDHAVALQERENLLREISQRVFDAAIERSAAALAYFARWQKTITAYLEWANEREEAGWHFERGEVWFEKLLSWEGGQVALRGCIDRIDRNVDGEYAILDYKTRNVQVLRTRLKEGEDHQLAFYGVLMDVPAVAGHYVALETMRGKTGDAGAEQFEEWRRLLEVQIVSCVKRIARGAPLPASGVERICVYCEVRGLCRKGAW
jgi:ATP-dependent helicase/nuclease subunit B